MVVMIRLLNLCFNNFRSSLSSDNFWLIVNIEDGRVNLCVQSLIYEIFRNHALGCLLLEQAAID